MNLRKIDIKTIFIIILSFGLVISFLLGQNNKIDHKKDEIKKLNSENEILLNKTDSLKTLTEALEKQIFIINQQIQKNEQMLADSEEEIKKLKQKRNETNNTVVRLSANGVTNELSNYIKKHKNGSIR
jgi:cupin superfamily acireductone dioxygenase involved in methionine salvage